MLFFEITNYCKKITHEFMHSLGFLALYMEYLTRLPQFFVNKHENAINA